jgi:hypothetical protein
MMVREKVTETGGFGQKVVHQLPKKEKQNTSISVWRRFNGIRFYLEKRLHVLFMDKECQLRIHGGITERTELSKQFTRKKING